MPLLGYEWFQITGLTLGLFFVITAVSSPTFRQPRLMRYHIKIGRLAILFGFVHMFFALSALFFQFFP